MVVSLTTIGVLKRMSNYNFSYGRHEHQSLCPLTWWKGQSSLNVCKRLVNYLYANKNTITMIYQRFVVGRNTLALAWSTKRTKAMEGCTLGTFSFGRSGKANGPSLMPFDLKIIWSHISRLYLAHRATIASASPRQWNRWDEFWISSRSLSWCGSPFPLDRSCSLLLSPWQPPARRKRHSSSGKLMIPKATEVTAKGNGNFVHLYFRAIRSIFTLIS